MRVAIVGAGLVGERRARVAAAHPDTRPVLVVDRDRARAERVAAAIRCDAGDDWREAVGRGAVDAVVVATPNNLLAPVSIAALEAGKHVLCEKPMATRVADAEAMVAAARAAGKVLKIGFTLRHHPAVAKAREVVAAGTIGKPCIARACYGHGGRPGCEREWRFMPELSGGGELIDQGVHLIDLARWFLGECAEVSGSVAASVWKVAPLEDNAFAILRMQGGAMAGIHASLTQWKNRFSFEIFGEAGYCIVEGLGGSYGTERLTVGIRDAAHPPPGEEAFTYEGIEAPWTSEWEDFVVAARSGGEPLAGGEDGLRALRIVRAIYRSAELKKTVSMDTRGE